MKQQEQKNKVETGIIYARVSSKEQVENTSLGNQEKFCREYAERQGIKIVHPPFIERGESAKTADRTEFKKAIAFCTEKKSRVDNFIIYKLDRFSRNQEVYVTMRALLKRAGTKLRSVTEKTDETAPGQFLEGVLSLVAEYDNNQRSEKTTAGMRTRLEQGIWPWRAPLGYFRPYKGSNIFPDPKTAPLIRLSFEKYAEGTFTYEKLAEFVSERGLMTKRGKPLSAQLMEKIIKNKLYSGFMDVWIGYNGDFEPVVSKELFAKCQAKNMSSTHAGPRSINNTLFPLRKVVECSHCKTGLTGSVSRGRNKQYAYYHHGHQKCPSAQAIPKEAFEQMFVEYLEDLTPSPQYEKLFKGIVVDTWQTNYKELDEENTKVRKSISMLEEERQKVFELHRKGLYSDDELLEQKRLINGRIDAKYLLLEENRVEEFSMEEALEYCFSYVRNTAKAWVEADQRTKLQLQKLIFKSRISFDGEKLGTAELSPVYKINQAFQPGKSNLVAPRGILLTRRFAVQASLLLRSPGRPVKSSSWLPVRTLRLI